LAAAYGKLDDLPTSWYHLTSYLEKTSKEDARAARGLEKLEKKLMDTHRRVYISCEPTGATLHFGLEPSGTAYTCPITWWFEPSKQFVHVESKGFRAQSAHYHVRERGEKGVWTVKLMELPRSGYLVVKGQGKAIQVYLNGNLEGTVPFKRKLQTGSYELMVGKPGEMPWKKTITVKANQTVVEAPPNAQQTVASGDGEGPPADGPNTVRATGITGTTVDDSPSNTAPFVLLASGVGAVVVGAVVAGLGYTREQELFDKYEPEKWDFVSPRAGHNESVGVAQSDYESAYADEVQPLKTMSYVLYGVGGAAAAAGAVWYVINSTSTPEKSKGLKVLPLSEPGAIGAMLGLEF